MLKSIASNASSQTLLVSAVVGALSLAAASRADAVPLPDNSSCNTSTTNGCFRISNTNSVGRAITGVASGSGAGVTGSSTNGNGVSGTTNGGTSAAAIAGTVTTGNGAPAVRATSRLTVSGASALIAERVTAGGSFIGTGQAIHAVGGGVAIRAETDGTAISAQSFATGTHYGLQATVNPAGTGAAVYGDAGGSVTAWAADFFGDVNVTGAYYVNGSFVASDARLKTNLKDSPYGLKELLKLRAVTYQMKDHKDDGYRLGIIAQEIQKVLPELVTTNRATGMLAVDYTGIIPVAIKAVQEQERTIEQQAKLIARLDSRITVLEASKPSVASASFPVGAGTSAAALALLPLGLFAARRKRQQS
jgi:hypothetical protein